LFSPARKLFLFFLFWLAARWRPLFYYFSIDFHLQTKEFTNLYEKQMKAEYLQFLQNKKHFSWDCFHLKQIWFYSYCFDCRLDGARYFINLPIGFLLQTKFFTNIYEKQTILQYSQFL